MKKCIAFLVGSAAVLATAVPAGAATQVIDGSITSSLSMSTSPTSTVSGWSLASTGANTTSGGSIVMDGNQPYTVTVTADKTRMTEYITASSAYEATSPKALTAALTVTAVRSSGSAVTPGVGAVAVIGTSTTLATGTGLGTDTYGLTLSQTTSSADAALASGRTYHIVLTYTASSTL